MPTLEERLQKAQGRDLETRLLAAQSSSSEAFSHEAGRTIVNNALALPRGTGDVLALGAAGMEGGLAKLFGGDFDIGRRFEEQQGKFPANLLRAIPAPTIEGIGARTRSLPALMPGGDTFGERVVENRAKIDAEIAQQRAQHPIASKAGEVTGDVATIATGRLPLAKGINKLESKIAPKVTDMAFGGAVQRAADPGVARLMQRVVDSPAVRKLARGAGRSLETGAESVILDVAKGDDPLETAGYAAGGQLAGSTLITVGQGIFSGGPLKIGGKIALSAAAAGALIQTLKSTTPGGNDYILESFEAGFDKVSFALVLGLLGGLTGAGRLRGGKLAEDLPKLTDAIATIPRAATLSLLEDFVDADPSTQQNAERVLNKLAQNPDHFSDEVTKRLQKAIQNGGFIDEVKALEQDKTLQKELFGLGPPRMTK